nr:uncharacterized protein LOC117840641 [Setaria viridis]
MSPVCYRLTVAVVGVLVSVVNSLWVLSDAERRNVPFDFARGKVFFINWPYKMAFLRGRTNATSSCKFGTGEENGGYHTLLQYCGASPALCPEAAAATAARQSGHVELTRNHASMHSAWNPCPQPGTSRVAASPSPSSARHTAQSTFSAPNPAAATRTNTGSGDDVAFVVARGVRRAASPAT